MGVEEEQQIAVLGEVVVIVAESLVKGRRSGRRGRCSSWCWLVVRWSGGGVAVARWSCGGAVELCGGAPPRLAWPRRRPVVEKELVGWGIEVPGLPYADSGRCFI